MFEEWLADIIEGECCSGSPAKGLHLDARKVECFTLAVDGDRCTICLLVRCCILSVYFCTLARTFVKLEVHSNGCKWDGWMAQRQQHRALLCARDSRQSSSSERVALRHCAKVACLRSHERVEHKGGHLDARRRSCRAPHGLLAAHVRHPNARLHSIDL